MNIIKFYEELFETGNVRAAAPEYLVTSQEISALRPILMLREEVIKTEFPGAAPKIDVLVLDWASLSFFRASQAIVYRELSEDQVRSILSTPCPEADVVTQHYTVDLIFAFLPDLYHFSKAVSHADFLNQILLPWANQFPLSSVGMMDQQTVDFHAYRGDESFWQYYLERIVKRGDKALLKNPVIEASIKERGYVHVW